jgi:enoyl-CoA hydratase/carnithine racemase/acyl carrier protein
LAQSSFPALLHEKRVVANGTAHFGVLQDQIGSTCGLQSLACVPTSDALLDESWQPPHPAPACALAGAVPVHSWLLPTVNSQLGILVESLMTLSHEDDGCVVLELDDARHYNAMDLPLMHALRSNLARLEASTVSQLCSVVLQGAGAHFCSGGAAHSDAAMPQVAPASAASLSAVVEDISGCVTLLRDLSVPVLSALHGKLTGGGVALALNTDWRVCTLAAKFNHGNLPRNHSPIGGFGGSFGATVGPSTASVSYLSDLAFEGDQALWSGMVDALEIDVSSARHRTSSCASIAHSGWYGHKKPEKGYIVSIESVMHAASAVENGSLNVVQPLPLANITKFTKFVAGLQGLGQHGLVQGVESMVQSKVHEVFSGTRVSANDPLMESGVDSLAATELVNSIQQELGHATKLPSTLTFDYPTIKEIAAHITSALQPQQGTQSTHLTHIAVLEMVLSKVHEVVSGTSVSADDPLMESGVDSLASTELRNSLQRELGTSVKLPSTLVSSICLLLFGC